MPALPLPPARARRASLGPVGRPATSGKWLCARAAQTRHLGRGHPDDRACRAVVLTLESEVCPIGLPIMGRSSPRSCAPNAKTQRRNPQGAFLLISANARLNDVQRLSRPPPNWWARGSARLA